MRLLGAGILLVVFLVLGSLLGPVWISPEKIFAGLFFSDQLTANQEVILWSIRLPRVICAALVGASLSLSGVVFQSLLKNPLADPFILGVSGGAAVGAVSALFLFGLSFAWVAPMAFCGGIAALGVVFLIVRMNRLEMCPETLLLSGVVVSFFSTAVVLLTLYLSDNQSAQTMMQWLMGGIAQLSYLFLLAISGFLAISLAVFYFHAKELDILAFGDEIAASSGVAVQKTRVWLLILAAILASLSVAYCGVIGFVGLMIPHLCRLIFESRHQVLVVASVLVGAVFMIVADVFCRLVLVPRELPIGIVTAFLGVPFFVALLRQRNRMINA